MKGSQHIALSLTLMVPLLSAQSAPNWPSWQVKVVDTEGAAIASAHLYVHNMGADDTRQNGDGAVTFVADSSKYGALSLPASVRPRDLLVFAAGFKPYVGFVDAGPGTAKTIQVKMEVVPCNYPGVNCDTFGPPIQKKRKH